jgi:hypothetical protein
VQINSVAIPANAALVVKAFRKAAVQVFPFIVFSFFVVASPCLPDDEKYQSEK